MNKQKLRLNDLIVFLLLILQERCMFLIPFEWFYSINSNQQQFLMVVVILIELVIFEKKVVVDKNSFSPGISLFVFYYIIELIISAMCNQGIKDSLISSNFYLIVLLYFPLMNYLKRNEPNKLYKCIVFITVITMIIYLIQFILSFRQIYFLHIDFSRNRFGNLRIQEFSDVLICYGIIISFVKYLNSKSKIHGGIFCFGVLGNLIISKGRFSIIALISTSIVIILIKNKNKAKKILKVILGIIMLLLILSQTNIFRRYIKSFKNKEDDTSSIRIREIEYYNSLTFNSIKNTLFGLGFIRDNGDELSDILKGPSHQYSRTDVGIFGLMNAIGMIGTIWYLYMISKCVKKIKILYRNEKSESFYILLGMIIFNIAYIPMMITLNPFSITCFTIMLSLIDFEYLKEIKSKGEKNV